MLDWASDREPCPLIRGIPAGSRSRTGEGRESIMKDSLEPQLDPPGASGATGRALQSELPEFSLSEREALRDRDAVLLERFYEGYFDRVYAYVRRLLREEHLAEDVTQDIFMHVHRSLSRYDPTRDLRPWVFTIATNKVRDHWRSRRHQASQREISTSSEDDEVGLDLPSSDEGPVQALATDETSELVARAIEQLPEGMRTTLVMRYQEGLSFAEIAGILDRNEAAVRKRYSRALAELRSLLEDQLGPPSQGAGPEQGGLEA